MSGPVVVVGASGNVGGAAARALIERGAQVRPAGTSLERLSSAYPGTQPVRLDLCDPTTFAPALTGAEGLFLVRPPHIARVGPTLNALVDAAIAQGVAHIVFCSVLGAETNRIVPHHGVERHLRRAAQSWTILRPGFFSQNLADAYRTDIARDDRVFLPAGSGRVAFIDTRDIGAAAARVLLEPGEHRGAGYTLTGAEALGFEQVAAILTRHLGRAIRYEPASVPSYLRHLHHERLPISLQVVQTVLHTGLRRGDAEEVDPTLARLLGRAPLSFEDYVRDHVELWSPGVPAAR